MYIHTYFFYQHVNYSLVCISILLECYIYIFVFKNKRHIKIQAQDINKAQDFKINKVLLIKVALIKAQDYIAFKLKLKKVNKVQDYIT